MGEAEFMGGAIISGVIHGGLDYAEVKGLIGSYPLPWPIPDVPDLATLGISSIPWAIGILAKNKQAKEIGEGMLAYSIPMTVYEIIVKVCQGAPAVASARSYVPSRPGLSAQYSYRPKVVAGPYAGGITAPKFIPGVLTPKYQLGS